MNSENLYRGFKMNSDTDFVVLVFGYLLSPNSLKEDLNTTSDPLTLKSSDNLFILFFFENPTTAGYMNTK